MVEISPVNPPTGAWGRAEKPRRFVSDNRGGGYWTSISEAEEAEAKQRFAAEQAARLRSSLAMHPSVVARVQAEQDAGRQRAWDERWPDSHAALREAHDALREADRRSPSAARMPLRPRRTSPNARMRSPPLPRAFPPMFVIAQPPCSRRG